MKTFLELVNKNFHRKATSNNSTLKESVINILQARQNGNDFTKKITCLTLAREKNTKVWCTYVLKEPKASCKTSGQNNSQPVFLQTIIIYQTCELLAFKYFLQPKLSGQARNPTIFSYSRCYRQTFQL